MVMVRLPVCASILKGMQYHVTAVVVSYNRARLLDECLSALNAQTRRPDSLVIVDNASTDGALQVARDFAGRTPIPAHILELRENTGGAGGFCAGIAYAVANGSAEPGIAEYVWLMDDDTVPTPTALEQLLAAADECVAVNDCLPTALGSKAV